MGVWWKRRQVRAEGARASKGRMAKERLVGATHKSEGQVGGDVARVGELVGES
jgi:hypothetical protein